MATLILGTVGRVIGGPLGGLIGTFVGQSIDRAVLGGGKRREVGRLANLAVQSSAYGEPIPRLYGTMRVAGNLVWTAGIAEHSSTSGGGKRGGPKTTSYTYSSSFAVLLAARRVARIGRVWADGKLLRDAGGAWLSPVTMRVHAGDSGQPVDPLIAAAEGAGGTPAYRGRAYAVFEDLPLADYGNRIPNLTFELVADETGCDAGGIVADLGGGAVATDGSFVSFAGFAAARSGSVRDQIGALTEVYDLRFTGDAAALTVRAGPGVGATITAGDLGSHDAEAKPEVARSEARGASGQVDDAVALAFADPARDYQPGSQRVSRRADVRRTGEIEISAALAADDAKGLAAAVLARRSAARTTATLNLPVRALAARAGQALARPGDPTPWSVRRWTFSNFVAELAVEARPTRLAGAVAAEPGRVHDAGDAAPGPTTLVALDLPPLGGETPTTPRLWVAGAGAAAGWRRSGVALSLDGGETYATAGEIGAPSAIGALTAALPAGCDDRWDRAGRIEIELLSDALWLESRSEAAVLAGANLAAIDGEVVQFAEVAPLGALRFALTTLLRGRRGSLAAAHAAGARFVLLDAERLLAIDPGVETIGRTLRLRATGAGDAATPPLAALLTGNALRPPPPARLRCTADGGDAVFGWTRRSRGGFGWPDGVDAPLVEGPEFYRIEVAAGGTTLRTATVATPMWRYDAAARAVDAAGAGTPVTVTVAQIGDLAGPGAPATAHFTLS